MSDNHKLHLLHKIVDINAQIQNITGEMAKYLMCGKQTNVRKQTTYSAQRQRRSQRQRLVVKATTNERPVFDDKSDKFFEME